METSKRNWENLERKKDKDKKVKWKKEKETKKQRKEERKKVRKKERKKERRKERKKEIQDFGNKILAITNIVATRFLQGRENWKKMFFLFSKFYLV